MEDLTAVFDINEAGDEPFTDGDSERVKSAEREADDMGNAAFFRSRKSDQS